MAKPYYQQLLDDLIRRGRIWVEKGEYIGKTSQGQEVLMGVVGQEEAMATYLYSHQTPDTW